MMFLGSSLTHEQRIDACYAGQPVNTQPVRCMRLCHLARQQSERTEARCHQDAGLFSLMGW